ncbi:MAG: divalent-cation tolerance protein CutA [Candidatus Bathycorpusculaceae bacterium]
MEKTYMVVLVTTSSRAEAEKIANCLLNEKLIACANLLGPLSSVFAWKGKIKRAEEYLLLMKSRLDLFGKLSERVKALHSYEVPEIIALPITKGLDVYLNWLEDCLGKVL